MAEVPAIIRTIDAKAAEFASSLPAHIPSDKFVRVIKTAISKNRKLLECRPADLLNECMKAAADGLVLDGREAVLNIYNTKRRVADGKGGFSEEWVPTPQYIPMYQGLIKRARNSGELKNIQAYLVGENEPITKIKHGPNAGKFHFRRWIDGDGEHIEHEPMLSGAGNLAGAYSVARMSDGHVDFCWMNVEDIRRIMVRTKSKDKDKNITGPWKTDHDEMVKKTVIRRHSKTLPMDSDLARAFSRDDDMYDLNPSPPKPSKERGIAAARLNAPEIVEDADYSEIEDEKPEPATRPKRKAAAAAKPQPQQPAASEDEEDAWPEGPPI